MTRHGLGEPIIVKRGIEGALAGQSTEVRDVLPCTIAKSLRVACAIQNDHDYSLRGVYGYLLFDCGPLRAASKEEQDKQGRCQSSNGRSNALNPALLQCCFLLC